MKTYLDLFLNEYERMKKLNSVIYKDKIQKCYKTQNFIASELCACVENLMSSMDMVSGGTPTGNQFEKPKHAKKEKDNSIKKEENKINEKKENKNQINENKENKKENENKINEKKINENKINENKINENKINENEDNKINVEEKNLNKINVNEEDNKKSNVEDSGFNIIKDDEEKK